MAIQGLGNNSIQETGRPYGRTSSDLYNQDKEQSQTNNLKALGYFAGTTSTGYLGLKYFRDNVKFDTNKSNYLKFLDYAYSDTIGGNESIYEKGAFGSYRGNTGSGADLILESIRRFEEYSPGKLGRTFQFSPLLSPFLQTKGTRMYFDGAKVRENADYYSKLLKREGNFPEDTNSVLRNGFVLENNKLYAATKDGAAIKDKVLMNEARLSLVYQKVPQYDPERGIRDSYYKNKVFNNYANALGAEFNVSPSFAEGGDPFVVIGGKSKRSLNFEYGIRAYGRTAFQRGIESFDHPLGFAKEWVPEDSWTSKFIDKLKLNMGTKGRYNLGVRESLLEMSKNVATKLAFGGIAFYALDSILRTVTPDDNDFSKGIVAGLAGAYANTRIGYAELVSDRFKGLKESQEAIAPGSTSLTTLAGLPASFALAGVMGSYGKYLWDAGTKNYETAIQGASTTASIFKNFISKELPRAPRWAARGALLGLALELPFIPGALLTGDSSEDLEAEYSGEKEVPVYANRWWMGGGGAWEGGKIKYFRPSLVALFRKDIDTIGKYGDADTAASLNPILHPFDYLRDPYREEKLTNEDSPYPIWGMDVSTGSFFGKFYERTIGQLIKPDIMNPDLANLPSGEGGVGEGIGFTKQEDGSYSYNQKISPTEQSLIDDGLMLPRPNARYDPNLEAAKWSFDAFKDFIGIKGFMIDQVQQGLGLDIDGVPDTQLAKSGEMSNDARDITELNLGGMLGLGEGQRRFIPTNSGAIADTVNPLPNNMPNWLPNGEGDYYLDFSKGDPYRKVEMGYARLPGRGYEELHPELKGVDPNMYPDIYKYKILTDVALGSDQYWKYKKIEEAKYRNGQMEDAELNIYLTIKEQEAKRAETKQFVSNENTGLLGSYWNFLTTDLSELPYEKLSIIRPSSKFIHRRTAIEDYEATQIDDGDAGMWDKPVSHYISPFATQIFRAFGSDYKPEGTEERYKVDDYFDKLEYIKYRNLYKEAIANGDKTQAQVYQRQYKRTLEGSLTSGLDDSKEIMYAFTALPKREREYFNAFFNAEPEDREEILNLVPSQVGALYSDLWERKDIIAKNYNPETGAVNQEAVTEQIQELNEQEAAELAKQYSKEYNTYKSNSKLRSQGTFKEYIADLDAAQYVNQTTGIPDKNFVGWDPRIDIKDIKLRSLSIGEEDLYEYGFFKSDTDKLKRMIGVLKEEQVTSQLESIKAGKRTEASIKDEIRSNLIRSNINPRNIDLIKTNNAGSITFNVEETE